MLWCTSTAPSWQVLYPLLLPKWLRISLSFPQEFLPVSLTPEAATGQFRATKEKDYLQQIHSKLHDANEATFRKLFHSNRMRDWRPAVPQAQVLTTEGKIDHQLMLYSHSQNNFHPPRSKNSRGLEKWLAACSLCWLDFVTSTQVRSPQRRQPQLSLKPTGSRTDLQ